MVRGDWGCAPLLPRPFSLAYADVRETLLLLKVVGEGSRRLACLDPGCTVRIHGPLGSAFRPPSPGERLLLVGGGVGIAPLLFLARRYRGAGAGRIAAIYAGRSVPDLPVREDLAAAVDELVLATEDGTAGARGLATDAMATELDRASFDRVAACGPTGMMAAASRIAAARGIPCEVSLETAMACGYGICLGCAVPRVGGGYLYACKDGPVVDGAAVEWDGPLSGNVAGAAGRAS
jgi:dihydroorotate dehydrogenase electron transfer subunit